MMKKRVLFAALLASAIEATPTLSPNGPVYEVISAASIGGASVISPISVSGSTDGFLITCEDTNNNLNTRFFNSGSQEWGTIYQTPDSTTNIDYMNWGPALVCNTTEGAMIAWTGSTIGYNSGYPYAGFTSDYGNSWGPSNDNIFYLPEDSAMPTDGVPVVGVSGSSDGFMFVWYDGYSSAAPYWAWSTYNGSSWSAASSGTIPIPMIGLSYFSTVAGTIDTGFMAVWAGGDGNLYTSYTDNEGEMWTNSSALNTMTGVDLFWIAGNTDGFLVVWEDASNNLWSRSYDLNTDMWQDAPVFVTTGLAPEEGLAAPYVTGSAAGFVATWLDPEGNAHASLSVDHGATWSDPIQINTVNGSVLPYYCGGAYGCDAVWFVGASIVGNSVLFTWTDTSYNAQSRFYTISAPSSSPSPLSKGGFFEPIIPNRPSGGLFR